MGLPIGLVQQMQGDYVASKYKDGMQTFITLDEDTLLTIVISFLQWAEKNEFIDEKGLLNTSEMKDW